jgi:hypothetical protein
MLNMTMLESYFSCTCDNKQALWKLKNTDSDYKGWPFKSRYMDIADTFAVLEMPRQFILHD